MILLHGYHAQKRTLFWRVVHYTENNLLLPGAYFHAQQCTEKYMKALLLSRSADFPKTHDLLLLNNLCATNGILLEIDPKHLNTLTDYAVRTRYPGNDPTAADAKEAIELAKLVLNFARKFLEM